MSFLSDIQPVVINRRTINKLRVPKHLKEQANYKPIQKKLFGILQSTHSHADMLTWTSCYPCALRMKEFQREKAKLGFRSSNEFMQWEKIGNEKMKNER